MDHGNHGKLVLEDATFAIRAAVFDVSRSMGIGFLEAVYQECLALEFGARTIPFAACRPLHLDYKGVALKQTYVPDFICFDEIIVELKVVRELAAEHRAQVINYLKATGFKLALLVKFGSAPMARIERIVR